MTTSIFGWQKPRLRPPPEASPRLLTKRFFCWMDWKRRVCLNVYRENLWSLGCLIFLFDTTYRIYILWNLGRKPRQLLLYNLLRAQRRLFEAMCFQWRITNGFSRDHLSKSLSIVRLKSCSPFQVPLWIWEVLAVSYLGQEDKGRIGNFQVLARPVKMNLDIASLGDLALSCYIPCWASTRRWPWDCLEVCSQASWRLCRCWWTCQLHRELEMQECWWRSW